MADHPPELIETTINGPRSRRWVLEAADCAELAGCGIERLGIEMTRAPYRRVRLRPAGSFFLVCMAGVGRVLLDGRWQKIAAETLCMAPPRVLNAFYAPSGAPWTFAWVRYAEPPKSRPLVGADSPLLASAGGAELARVIAGLRAEWDGPREAPLIHHWASLVHGLTTRLSQPWRGQHRLWRLWQQVGAQLDAAWSLAELAHRVHLSGEHLRRLCLRELGRSPMQHLTYMRMQQARALLEASEDKLEAIAPQVGYENALVFSRAFKRWVGCAPSEYRGTR